MLAWAGIFLIVLGAACVAIDRRAVHVFYDCIPLKFDRFLHRTTHFAKAGHWLIAAVVVFAASWGWRRHVGESESLKLAQTAATAFVCALALGSAVLHAIKLVLGRRRPRDEIEMGLYGFVPFAFDLRMNSFPSGHSLTIFIVACLACVVWPAGTALWFALALWLALTRAMLCAHFLSDVFVGAGFGLISAREVLVNFFPQLTLSWF
jgi:membrane-associated phospholipid phosphatase